MVGSRAQILDAQVSLLRRQARRERRWTSVTLYVGVGIVGVLALAAILAPLLAPYSPNGQDLLSSLEAPSAHHLFGTDELGRDIFSRVLYAGRVDFQIGVITTYVPLVTGMAVGAIAGYFGGWVDALLMRLVDVVIAFPFMILVIALLTIIGPGLTGLYIAVLAVGWSIYARLTRAEMLVLREQQFILAGEALGFSRLRVITRHALPNLLRPNLVFSMSDFVLNILLAASLSFLGLGVQPPQAEWGAMVAEGQTYLLSAWWITTLPGIVIVVVGVGLSLIGDGLAERLGERFRLTG